VFKFHIKKLLCPLDLYHFSISCKSFARHISIKDIERNATIRIRKQLIELFGDNYTKFKNFFKKHEDVVVTGSIIIRAIMGEILLDDDAKIYVLVNDRINLNEFVDELNPKCKLQWCMGLGRPDSLGPIHITGYKKIIIELRSDNMEQAIIGDGCYYKFNERSIHNVQFLLIKQINVQRLFLHSIFLIPKYYNLGFKFYDDAKLLSNDELLSIFLKYQIHDEIKQCDDQKSHFVHESNTSHEPEYYNSISVCYYGQRKIFRCGIDSCFVRILSPTTNHFHDNLSGSILIIKE